MIRSTQDSRVGKKRRCALSSSPQEMLISCFSQLLLYIFSLSSSLLPQDSARTERKNFSMLDTTFRYQTNMKEEIEGNGMDRNSKCVMMCLRRGRRERERGNAMRACSYSGLTFSLVSSMKTVLKFCYVELV